MSQAAGATATPSVDKNMSMCRSVNERAYDWALSHADPTVRARFEEHGEPFVMVDDQEVSHVATTYMAWKGQEVTQGIASTPP